MLGWPQAGSRSHRMSLVRFRLPSNVAGQVQADAEPLPGPRPGLLRPLNLHHKVLHERFPVCQEPARPLVPGLADRVGLAALEFDAAAPGEGKATVGAQPGEGADVAVAAAGRR